MDSVEMELVSKEVNNIICHVAMYSTCVHFCCGWCTICHSDDSALCTACTDCPKKGLAHVLMSLMEEKGHPKADENKKERRSKDLDKDARKALELLCLCILVIQTSVWSQWKTGSRKKLELVWVSGKVTLVPEVFFCQEETRRERKKRREKTNTPVS